MPIEQSLVRLWEVNHPYYCSDDNYFASQDKQTSSTYRSWAEFLADRGDDDPHLNFLFRWDWNEGADHDLPAYTGDDYYRCGHLKLYFMVQRKGYHQAVTVEVCRADEPAVRTYLEAKAEVMRSTWVPLLEPAQ